MKKKVWIGIDPSLRGSGFVAIDEDENIVRMMRLAPPPKLFKDEELLDQIAFQSGAWFCEIVEEFDVQGYAMEMIAFGGKSGSKDKIAAGWWEVRRVMIKCLLGRRLLLQAILGGSISSLKKIELRISSTPINSSSRIAPTPSSPLVQEQILISL